VDTQFSAEPWNAIFDSVSDMVSIQDTDFKLVMVNRAFADALGLDAERLSGKKCYEVIHGTDAPWPSCPHMRTLETGRPHTDEFFEPRLGLHVEVSASPLRDEEGNLCGTVHIIRDITARKRAERENAELLHELEGINRDLNDFAHIISHDLKAPLRGIKSLVGWLIEDYVDKLDDNAREQMDMLARRVDRMHNLIDGVLQYSRVAREKEERVEVDLNQCLREAIEMVGVPQNISVTIDGELPTVRYEPTRARQVFQNLLSNAVKYMDKPQGRIRITCDDLGDCWRLAVTDNGPGIEEKHRERIFQMFQTLSPRDEFESTGVGLTVIKKIVEMHGGRIWVESEPGKASTFFFTIPKQSDDHHQSQAEHAQLGAHTPY